MDRDSNGARLIGNRARDRLPDPPRRVGRKLIPAPVLELVDRLHQADVAFLNEIEELQTAVGILFRNRDDEAEVGLHHFLLRLPGLPLALLNRLHDAAELRDFQPRLGGEVVNVATDALDHRALLLDEVRPLLALARDLLDPRLIEFVAEIFADKILPAHTITVGKPHQTALETDEALIDRIKLFDEAFDTRVIQRQRLHIDDNFVADFFISLLLLARALFARHLLFQLLILLLAQLLVGVGDAVEGFKNLRLQLRFHRGQRQRVFEIFLIIRHVAAGSTGRSRSTRRSAWGSGRLPVNHRFTRLRLLCLGALVGRFQIDDVAQQDPTVVEFLHPDDDGLEGEGAFA